MVSCLPQTAIPDKCFILYNSTKLIFIAILPWYGNIELTDVCLNWFIFLEHMLNNVTHILMVIIKGKVDKI